MGGYLGIQARKPRDGRWRWRRGSALLHTRRSSPFSFFPKQGFKAMRDQGMLSGFESYTTEYLNRFLMSRISVRFLFNQVGAHEDPRHACRTVPPSPAHDCSSFNTNQHLTLFSEKFKHTSPAGQWIGAIRKLG